MNKLKEIITPTTCPICQSPLRERKGTSQKTGKPYDFLGCSNYPTCNYIYHPPSQVEQDQQKIIEALRTIWIKIDELDKKFTVFSQIFGKK